LTCAENGLKTAWKEECLEGEKNLAAAKEIRSSFNPSEKKGIRGGFPARKTRPIRGGEKRLCLKDTQKECKVKKLERDAEYSPKGGRSISLAGKKPSRVQTVKSRD